MSDVTNYDALAELIARLVATGPDRDLDASIAVAITPTVRTDDDLVYAQTRERDGSDATHPGHYFVKSRSGASSRTAPFYTISIDAALTLVPEGLYWIIACGRNKPTEPLYGISIVRPNDTENPVADAEHESLPICIALAALRARAASGDA